MTRLVTPGTITEDRLLDPGRANLFLAIARRRVSDAAHAYGLAALDISTGRFFVGETDAAGAAGRDRPIRAARDRRAGGDPRGPGPRRPWRETRAARDAAAAGGTRPGLRRAAAEGLFFGVATLDAFGTFSRAELTAAGAALDYVERTQLDSRPVLQPPSRESGGAAMAIDAATRQNLELTRTLSGERAGSLLSTIDRTVTPGGARLLAERLAGPLTDVAAIRARHDAVAWLVEGSDLRERLRRVLKRAPDIARALSRLGLGRGGPRDLAALRDGLSAARDLGAAIAGAAEPPEELAAAGATLAALDRGRRTRSPRASRTNCRF